MSTHIWTKKETQQTIKQLRAEGITVNKIDDGFYKAFVNDIQIFSALIGHYGYLVTLNNDFLGVENNG